MARRDDQDLYDVSDFNCRVMANCYGPGQNRSSSVSRLRFEQCATDVDRYGQTGTEPTLDEVLREPAIRLMMKCDDVTEDQLLFFIGIARRHI